MGIRRGSISTPIIVDGLVFNMDAANRACYPRTGTTAIDTVDNNNGTISAATFSDVNKGVFSFDGTDDYITMGNILNTSSTGADAFSMSCWFKTNNTTSDGWLMGKALNVSGFDGYQMFIKSSGQIRFFLGRYTGVAAASPWIYVRTSSTWNDGNWHNVVLTYSGNQSTSGLIIYLDGASQTLTTLYSNTPSISSTSSEFMISARGTTSNVGGFFDGNIGPVHI